MATLVRAPMHKNRQTTMGRISGFYSTDSLFKTINLSSKIYGAKHGLKDLMHFPILGEHGNWMNYSYEQIKAGPWNPAAIGQAFGPTWTTHWFHVTFDPPPTEFMGKEVHFRFSSGTEATLYDMDFNILQGISPGPRQGREEYIVTKSWTGTEALEYYVEMACNHMFGAGAGISMREGNVAPPDPNRYWTLSTIELAIFNKDNFNLMVDLEQLYGIAEHLPDSHIGYQAMFAANEMVNLLRVNEIDEARNVALAFFSEGSGSKAHILHAMGHCHIDTAWLWPYDETIRKCARSFSAQLGLMDEYPGSEDSNEFSYKFVCSQAQQLVWVKEYYPKLFAKIKEKVAQGKFILVGGTWIEMDGNIPNGEAFMRQYYYGQKFFEEEFGIVCEEFWLPDTFGYSAQIPQMMNHVGISRFLTQKMSWSIVNKFPNHNFWWEGIDGTKVLVHFPPGDSYNMSGTVNELLNSQNNSLDKGRANIGVYLYGYGDGGGGPTRIMIERLKRVLNVDGLPKVVSSDSNTFFTELEVESPKFYKWVGELYLELHNGTYTTQGRIKWFNRKCEFMFREVELLLAIAYSMGKVTESEINTSMTDVDSCWKDFLLNQFHDVLPGTCIEFVTQDAWKIYRNLFTKLLAMRKLYNSYILGQTGSKKAVFNCLPWTVRQVIFSKPDDRPPEQGPNIQSVQLDTQPFEDEAEGWYRVPSQFTAALVTLQPNGFTEFVPEMPNTLVTFVGGVSPNFGTFKNGYLTLEVRMEGNIPVENLLFDDNTPVFNDFHKMGINPGMFNIYDDIPSRGIEHAFWDAWDVFDYHLETRREPDWADIIPPTPFAQGPIVGGYKWSAKFGNGSSLERYTILRADSPMLEYYTIVDWKEDHKLLKVEWPVDVLSREATFEIQYGHASRPTHINTSWDMAKFEVCGHKWMDISQADKGVAIITDSKYGWHVRDNHVSLSLLKSPKNPDANCDMHKHYIYYAVMPHKGTFQNDDVIQRAYDLNLFGSNNVSILKNSDLLPASFVTTSNKSVIVEAVKVSKASPSSVNTLCVRLYESHGGYAKDTEIVFSNDIAVTEVFESNGLEVEKGAVTPIIENKFTTTFKPFQIKSFLIKF